MPRHRCRDFGAKAPGHPRLVRDDESTGPSHGVDHRRRIPWCQRAKIHDFHLDTFARQRRGSLHAQRKGRSPGDERDVAAGPHEARRADRLHVVAGRDLGTASV